MNDYLNKREQGTRQLKHFNITNHFNIIYKTY